MKTTTEELNELKIQLQELRYHRCKYYNITSYYTLKNGFPKNIQQRIDSIWKAELDSIWRSDTSSFEYMRRRSNYISSCMDKNELLRLLDIELSLQARLKEIFSNIKEMKGGDTLDKD